MAATTLAEDRRARETPINAVETCQISECEEMDMLQENSQVTDECVHLKDVAGTDAMGAANWPK